ncbi:MlaD family protein [Williamsia sp.]|uniref:MlaD family protein n=1 Tax=Williamsia sp. TaxID=1872085 RepID=UPI002F954BF7
MASKAGRIIRRPVEKHNKAVLGAITVGIILVMLIALLQIANAGIGKTEYDADFAQAAGVSSGDSITVAGVQVGTVKATRLAGDHVVLTLEVDDDVKLGADTTASIQLTTLLGSRYVELKPAGAGSLPDGRLNLAHTQVPYDLQQLIDSATTTFEQVDFADIGETMSTLSDQLEGTPELMPQVLTNVESLSSIMADRRSQVGSLLTSTRQLTDVIRKQQGNLGSLVAQGREVLQEINTRRSTINQLFSATTELVDQLKTIVVDDRPAIDELIVNLTGMLQTLSSNDDLLRNALQILPVPIRNFANVSGTANEADFTSIAGPFVDSWMCAVSGRANQLNLPEYLKDCK